MHKLTFYPSGNADTTLVDINNNSKKMLIDFADRSGDGDKYCKLSELLKADLEAANRTSYNVVAFSHADQDHTQGADEFFHFDSSPSRQGDDRIKIDVLWVPAAFIYESQRELCTSSLVIQREARHRLREGYGIRVFSKPELLRAWLEKEGLNLEERAHLITDAGQYPPEFNMAWDNAEFFIHMPFASTIDATNVYKRNEESLAFQGRFRAGGRITQVLFMADVNADTIYNIVEITKDHHNEDRLKWDIMKISHHCSYKSLNCAEKGETKTTPNEHVKWLMEEQGEANGIMVSTSDPIPDVDTIQPPHFQAENYYLDVKRKKFGKWYVTQEYPTKENPKPLEIEITQTGYSVLQKVPSALGASLSTQSPRVGGE